MNQHVRRLQVVWAFLQTDKPASAQSERFELVSQIVVTRLDAQFAAA